jgi:hypothetical protein
VPCHAHRRSPRGGQAQDAHWVRVVEHPRAGAQFLAVAQHVQPDRRGAQRLHQAAGADGVANALRHAVLERNVVVEPDRVDAGDFDAVDDVVGPRQGLTAVGRGFDGPATTADGGRDLADQAVCEVEAMGVGVDQAELAARDAGGQHDVRAEGLAKPAAGAEEADGGHGMLQEQSSESASLRCGAHAASRFVTFGTRGCLAPNLPGPQSVRQQLLEETLVHGGARDGRSSFAA